MVAVIIVEFLKKAPSIKTLVADDSFPAKYRSYGGGITPRHGHFFVLHNARDLQEEARVASQAPGLSMSEFTNLVVRATFANFRETGRMSLISSQGSFPKLLKSSC